MHHHNDITYGDGGRRVRAKSDTLTATVRDCMILLSRGAAVGLLEWSSYQVTMVQSMVYESTQSFFWQPNGTLCNGRNV